MIPDGFDLDGGALSGGLQELRAVVVHHDLGLDPRVPLDHLDDLGHGGLHLRPGLAAHGATAVQDQDELDRLLRDLFD